MSNCCKVICTYFGRRLHRTKLQWPGHSQVSDSAEDALAQLKRVLEFERTVDAGVDYDTIVVNPDVGFEPGRAFLDSIDGSKTLRGAIRVMHRPNEGKNFGAFDDAFKRFRQDYIYFFFTPDDHVYLADGWLSKTVERLESEPSIGVVGPIGVGYADGDRRLVHCHDGISLTKRSCADKVVDRFGCLAHCPPEVGPFDNRGKHGHIMDGEVPFTNQFTHVGLRVVSFIEKYDRVCCVGETVRDGWPILLNGQIYAIPVYSLENNEWNCRRYLSE